MQVLQAMHVRISSNLPSWALIGISGSAINPRPMQTRSAIPLAMILSAVHGSLIRPTAITGICNAFLMAAADSARQAFCMNIG
jgi:hypothetical protein